MFSHHSDLYKTPGNNLLKSSGHLSTKIIVKKYKKIKLNFIQFRSFVKLTLPLLMSIPNLLLLGVGGGHLAPPVCAHCMGPRMIFSRVLSYQPKNMVNYGSCTRFGVVSSNFGPLRAKSICLIFFNKMWPSKNNHKS